MLIRTAIFAAALAAHAHAQQVWFTYDPAQGTLPDAQCWSLNGGPTPTLTAGVLELSSSYGGSQYYSREASISFSRGALIEADIFIVNTPFRGNPCGAGQRAGTYIALTDDQGDHVTFGIGNTRCYMTSSDPAFNGPGAPAVDIAAQGQWHRYGLAVSGGIATAFIDGVAVMTVPVADRSSAARQAFFGDMTVCGEGHARFGLVRVMGYDDCPIDFNRDRFVDFFDYDDYVTCFQTGNCPCDQTADFNGDDFVDFFDYDDFVAAFERGC